VNHLVVMLHDIISLYMVGAVDSVIVFFSVRIPLGTRVYGTTNYLIFVCF